ncbi:MAG: NYN domain-containing protein [bacterium]
MKRYAFIDVQNTETTTLKVLGFEVDHERLFLYLKEKWQCEKVFFYPGIEYGDIDREKVFRKISEIGGIIRPKYYYKYKNSDKIRNINCPNCGFKIIQIINRGHTWKCNCDVEMTIDILDYLAKDVEILIFTGDGDFGPLIERLLQNNIRVYLVSSIHKVRDGLNVSGSRFAKKLKSLIDKFPGKVIYLEINDWKILIEKK